MPGCRFGDAHVVDPAAAAFGTVPEIIKDLVEHGLDIVLGNSGRHGGDEEGAAAKVLDAEAEFLEFLEVLVEQGGILGRELGGDRQQ